MAGFVASSVPLPAGTTTQIYSFTTGDLEIWVHFPLGQSGNIFIGGSGVDNTNGLPLNYVSPFQASVTTGYSLYAYWDGADGVADVRVIVRS